MFLFSNSRNIFSTTMEKFANENTAKKNAYHLSMLSSQVFLWISKLIYRLTEFIVCILSAFWRSCLQCFFVEYECVCADWKLSRPKWRLKLGLFDENRLSIIVSLKIMNETVQLSTAVCCTFINKQIQGCSHKC